MSDPFLGEIRLFGGNFAPRGWALCSGQLLPISQNTALFSLLGTTYGGDGRSTYALPNFQGNAPVHAGTGPGLSQYVLGEITGTTTYTLTSNELPAHSHAVSGDNFGAAATSPGGNLFGKNALRSVRLYGSSSTPTAMGAATIGTGTGGGQAHANQQPFLVLTFIIALQGIYPSRS